MYVVCACEGQDVFNDFSTLFFEPFMGPNLCLISDHFGQIALRFLVCLLN